MKKLLSILIFLSISVSCLGQIKIHLPFPLDSALSYPNATMALGLVPGDTIAIHFGTYKYIVLNNVKGDSLHPIVIQNDSGLVTVGVNNTYTKEFEIDTSQYFELSGSGYAGMEYGFLLSYTSVSQGGQIPPALGMNYKCSDFNIHNIYIHGTGTDMLQGIVSITYAQCNDSTSQRNNYIQKNVKIHHCKIVSTGTEGMYLGRTNQAEYPTPCGDTVLNGYTKNIQVYDNVLDSTGKGAIQISLALLGTNKIFNNDVSYWNAGNYGGGFNVGIAAQSSPMKIFNNKLHGGTYQQFGIQFENSVNKSLVYNNVFSRLGPSSIGIGVTGGGYGGEQASVNIINNTFFNFPVYTNAIHYYGASNVDTSFILNNVYVYTPGYTPNQPDTGLTIDAFYLPNIIKWSASNNLYVSSVATAKFTDTSIATLNLRPLTGSPVIGYGINAYNYFVINDADGFNRSTAGAYDIGAYKYNSGYNPSNLNPVASGIVQISNNGVVTLPIDTAVLDATASFEPGNGIITSYHWSQYSGPNSSTIDSISSKITTVSGLIAGTYQYLLTVKNAAGDSSQDIIPLTVITALQGSQSPVVVVANDTSIVANSGTVFALNGQQSSDPGGIITIYHWQQLSGPLFTWYTGYTPYLPWTLITGLQSGIYKFQLTITDTRGLSSSTIQTVTVSTSGCNLIISNVAPTACTNPNNNDGTITVTASTSAMPIQYSLDNLTFQSNNVFTGLTPGVYTIYVKDAANCTTKYQGVTVPAYIPPPPGQLIPRFIIFQSTSNNHLYSKKIINPPASAPVSKAKFQFGPVGINGSSGYTILAGNPAAGGGTTDSRVISASQNGITVSTIDSTQWYSYYLKGSNNWGLTTGNNSGIRPDSVLAYSMFTDLYNGQVYNGITYTNNLKISGLIPNTIYTIKLGASLNSSNSFLRLSSDADSTYYQFNGGTPYILKEMNNTANEITATATSTSGGIIFISARKSPYTTTHLGVIGWLEILQ